MPLSWAYTLPGLPARASGHLPGMVYRSVHDPSTQGSGPPRGDRATGDAGERPGFFSTAYRQDHPGGTHPARTRDHEHPPHNGAGQPPPTRHTRVGHPHPPRGKRHGHVRQGQGTGRSQRDRRTPRPATAHPQGVHTTPTQGVGPTAGANGPLPDSTDTQHPSVRAERVHAPTPSSRYACATATHTRTHHWSR